MVEILTSSSPSTKSGVTLIVELGINLILRLMGWILLSPGDWGVDDLLCHKLYYI